MDARETTLLSFAKEAEDAASGLHSFRDSLPRSTSLVTGAISELFAISSQLHKLCNAHGNRRLGASFYLIDYDLMLVFRTLRITLDSIFHMFAISRSASRREVWQDLKQQMAVDEGVGLLDRLEIYRDYLEVLYEVLAGRRPHGSPRELRARLLRLTDAQRLYQQRVQTAQVTEAGAPRPVPSRPNSRQRRRLSQQPAAVETTMWTSWNDPSNPQSYRPQAPEAPSPLSPAYTSTSSDTFFSSQPSSYFSDPSPQPSRHWALYVFDGRHPWSEYTLSATHDDQSVCNGTQDPQAIQNLLQDGFQQLIEIPFDEGQLVVYLYWRPHDQRARMLVMTVHPQGASMYYCQPLTNLKVIRSGSTLQFCRLHRDHRLTQWARLNFVFHERMVLFYSTFVAMKQQDEKPIAHKYLFDTSALSNDNSGNNDQEELLFAGEIEHKGMLHALRMLRDRPSDTVRLEACARRGPFKDVPIWTAFITKYAKTNDVAWAERDPQTGAVSLSALKHKPTVFTHGDFQPPRDGNGLYTLPFTSPEDTSHFIEQWTSLCRSYS